MNDIRQQIYNAFSSGGSDSFFFSHVPPVGVQPSILADRVFLLISLFFLSDWTEFWRANAGGVGGSGVWEYRDKPGDVQMRTWKIIEEVFQDSCGWFLLFLLIFIFDSSSLTLYFLPPFCLLCVHSSLSRLPLYPLLPRPLYFASSTLPFYLPPPVYPLILSYFFFTVQQPFLPSNTALLLRCFQPDSPVPLLPPPPPSLSSPSFFVAGRNWRRIRLEATNTYISTANRPRSW